MKVKFIILLVLVLWVSGASGAVIQGTSGVFSLTTDTGGPVPVPFTWLALAVFVGLLGMYKVFRSFRTVDKVSA